MRPNQSGRGYGLSAIVPPRGDVGYSPGNSLENRLHQAVSEGSTMTFSPKRSRRLTNERCK